MTEARDNFFKKYPQMFVGKDQGLGSVPEGGFQTRIGKIGGTLGEGIDYGLDAAAMPFRFLGRGIGNVFDYLTDKPQSTIDLEKQTALDYLSSFGKGQKYTPPPFDVDELRVEEDQGLIDSNIQKEINKLTNQKDTTKDATKGATDPNVSSDVAPEDEGLPSDIIKTDTTKADGKADKGTGGLTPEEQLMKSGMDSYIAALGEDVEVGSIEDYKKEFEKATGIDASGKVDKSMALTALGLALMQNKAGKGFNVGNILSEVGKAGEKALPALEKEKSEAKAGQLAAGKYALGQRQKDIATNQAKSQDIANKIFEINKMSIGQSFDMQKANQKFIYDLALQKQQLDDEIRIAQMTPEEYGDRYMKSATNIELIPGFEIKVQLPDRNYKGPDKVTPDLLTPIKSITQTLNNREAQVNRFEDEFEKVAKISKEGGLSIPNQIKSIGFGMMQAFGVAVEKEDPVAQARYILETIQAGNAPMILGEAGKTISDADRQRVEKFVGNVSVFDPSTARPQVLLQKLEKVYGLVVESARTNLDSAYSTLNEYGYPVGPMAEKVASANQVLEQ